MKKIFDSVTVSIGFLASVAVMMIVLYVALFSIDEGTGKAIAGTTKTIKGTITGIACHPGTQDISFTVKGFKRSFYINRGLEKGYDCEELREELINKEVEISHVAFFSKLISGHINRLRCDGEVVYSELN